MVAWSKSQRRSEPFRDDADTPDVMGLAVPIRYGEHRFGLALAGPIYRMEPRRMELAAVLRPAARRIHALLLRD